MKLLLSSLQLASLCALSSWSVSSEVVVRQSKDVTVEEGAAAKISCCIEGIGWKIVTWLKNQSVIDTQRLNEAKCSFLTLENITKDHEGTYFCKVTKDIPILETLYGNGTVLTVKFKNETSQKQEIGSGDALNNVPLFAVIAVAPILLIALICVICQRRKRVQAARVIYEVPHFDSETPDPDKGSTGSRGSSQWCQVPVYESFDYFEHTEAKKSG
ncbi:hypothetical protein NL108_015340 [Boleophthalmus pectinirostris]|uniref:uncharacterized protein LOC110173727 n=1 Tax=Boleophthalmus pectinirostris TaxID=150288 RepID=UPI0024321B1C|nr:uncharacterized protein LOC110173727 [Boleophthalmus pectinirostris]KAJ0055906.1 hypothetical protein NL108_015340 [Boleophthalmus pectinirostris]